MEHPNKEIMQRAISIASAKHVEGGAVAAIIVRNDTVIAEAIASVRKDKDPTCHAEINAIRLATKEEGSIRLKDCYLYSTYEPCPMCTSAAIWARMRGIVYGATMADATEKYSPRIKIHCPDVIAKGTPELKVYPGFMREECKALLSL